MFSSFSENSTTLKIRQLPKKEPWIGSHGYWNIFMLNVDVYLHMGCF